MLAIQDDVNRRTLANDGVVVPLAGRFDRSFAGGKSAKDGSATPGAVFRDPWLGVIIGNLNFDRVGDPLFDIGYIDEHAAVRSRAVFKFEVEDVVFILFCRPQDLIFAGG